MEVISSSSGNGSKGVVDSLLRLLLKMNEESVASFHHITKGSPTSRMSPKCDHFLPGEDLTQPPLKERA